MKKLWVVLGLAMTALSLQVNAASLSLFHTYHVGDYTNFKIESSVNSGALTGSSSFDLLDGTKPSSYKDTFGYGLWGIQTGDNGNVIIDVIAKGASSWITDSAFRSVSSSVWTKLTHVAQDHWQFVGDLGANTKNYINLFGALTPGSYGYSISVKPNYVQNAPVETPIPAAVWLFGSALLGMFGVARRKSV